MEGVSVAFILSSVARNTPSSVLGRVRSGL